MYTICIDTSVKDSVTVRLIKQEEVIEECTGNIDAAQTIKELIEKHRIKKDEITEFKAFPGPGSFTGLKKGVTIANILNWAYGIKPNPNDFEVPNYGKEPNIQTN